MDAETRAWLQERINGRLAAGIGIGWLVAYQVAAALEPVTHKPEPWYGIVLEVTFLGLIAAMATGLVMERRWGLLLSLGAAGFFTALSVACPVSGHHPFGAWWFGQMACALGMVGASFVALGRPAVVPIGPPEPEFEPESDDDVVASLTAGDGASRG